MRIAIVTMLLAIFAASVLAESKPPLVVHEWGTFTSLQDETGRTIGGINVDEEALPAFVHQFRTPVTYVHEDNKGAGPASRPDVTMRLETPVLYFHPQPGSTSQALDVHVQFNGGWLTQFYPNATAQIDNAAPNPDLASIPLTANSIGSLRWDKMQLGLQTSLVKTDDHVWLAPRNVDAANITSPKGETEKYIFYRGVGHVDAPVLVTRNADNHLFIHNRHESTITGPFWLLDVRQDGMAAYRVVDSLDKHLGDFQAEASATFAANQYTEDNIAKLRKEMHGALVQAGLFADEADALLDAWELSYFKSPGQRLFFLVPRQWTDRVLPLSISVPADIQRVMVGRIELVGPREWKLVKFVANYDLSWMEYGKAILLKPPDDYPAYLQANQALGRFHDALILDYQSRHSTTRPAASASH